MSISSEQLDQALQSLQIRWQKADLCTKWEQVRLFSQHETRFLRITRSVEHDQELIHAPSQEHVHIDEDDEEALQLSQKEGNLRCVVEYDIVHSPSYQVPVLYLTLRDVATSRRPPIDKVYELLVPDAYQSQMQAVGVLGALSLTEHPVNRLPWYFVHPCRTREAMEPLLSGKKVSPESYLVLWIGMIGAGVGLTIPVELAEGLETFVEDSLTPHGRQSA